MKKTKKKKSIKPAKENLPSGRIRRHTRIIPWAMVFLVVFYLVSLIAIIQIYPEVFFVSESHAQIKATNLQGMTNLLGTTTTHQTATPKAIETNSTSTDTTSTTEAKSTLSTSPVQTGTTTTAPIDSSVSATKATDSSNTSTATQMQTSTANTVTSSTTSSTETTNSSKTTNISPELKFSDPADGARIKGQQVFAASVEAAQGVEFYITKKGSLTDNFLCSAKKLSENKWKCEVQTSDIPNGEYELMAKIKNNYGTYKSSAITIKVANETASISSTSDSSSTSANISSATRTSSETNSGDNAASSGGSASQTTKATVQEVQKVQETVEKRSREQNTQNEIAGKATSANATVAGSLSQSIDSDRDGISNEEERRIGTDPYSADTDKDGYLDGDEIKNGFNPLKPSIGGDKIVFESPKEKGGVKKELVQINSVEMVANSAEEAEKNIQLKGKALPLSFVTIYIYSETPTIVTVMTDENGNWTYTMDKSIENGQHEAYVAITDNEGHITAKNEPFFFVKTAEAATESSAKEAALQNSAATESPVAASRTKQVAVIGFVIIISLFTLIACIGLFLAYRYHHKKIESVVKKDFLETK